MTCINELLQQYSGNNNINAESTETHSSQLNDIISSQSLGTCLFADIYDIKEFKHYNSFFMLIRDGQRWAIGVINREPMVKWMHLSFEETIVRCALIRVYGIKEMTKSQIGPKLQEINGGCHVLLINRVNFYGIGPTFHRHVGPIPALDIAYDDRSENFSPERTNVPPKEIWVVRDAKHAPIEDSTSESEAFDSFSQCLSEIKHNDCDEIVLESAIDYNEEARMKDYAGHSSDSMFVYSEAESLYGKKSKSCDIRDENSDISSKDPEDNPPSSPTVQDNGLPCVVC